MRASTLLPGLLAAASTALAAVDTSTIYMFFPNADIQTLAASVIDVTASTTRYLVGCPTSVAAEDCGFNPPETVVHAGSVYAASVTASGVTLSYECTLFTSGETSAVCESNGETATLAESEITYQPVTITAGVSKLVSAAATAATMTIPTGSGSSSGKVTLVGTSVATAASSTAAAATAATNTSGSSTESAASAGRATSTATDGGAVAAVATMGLGFGAAAGLAALALAL